MNPDLELISVLQGENAKLRAVNDRLQIDFIEQRKKTEAVELQVSEAVKAFEEIYKHEGPGLDGSSENASGKIARLAIEKLAVKRNDEIKGIKADGTGTTEDRCRRCYPNPGIAMSCAGLHGCYCGCHGSGSIRIRG